MKYSTERVYTAPQPFVPLLGVCRDSRQVVLRNYVRINADMKTHDPREVHHWPWILTSLNTSSDHGRRAEEVKAQEDQGRYYLATLEGKRPFALLDPKSDILFLQDPPRNSNPLGAETRSSLATLIRWVDAAVLRNLRRLALPYSTWKKMNNFDLLHLLLEFKELEELCISFLGGVPVGVGAMCADEGGVEELGSHVREVEVEVTGDVEGLKRLFPEWMNPKVKVVKHIGIIRKELEG